MADIYLICANVYLKKCLVTIICLNEAIYIAQVLAYDSFGGKPVLHSALTNVNGHRNILLRKSN